jgi:hypothetical protein
MISDTANVGKRNRHSTTVKTGCACGCGGTYASTDSLAGQKRIKKIMNADPAKLAAFDFGGGEGCIEIGKQNRHSRHPRLLQGGHLMTNK